MGVTLHVSLAPPDWRHAGEVLPHQLRTWAAQVDDVQLTVDALPSRGRFAPGAADDAARLRRLLDQVQADHPQVRVREVDYAPAAAAAVAERFFGGRPVPRKSHYGAAYYAYFYGWHTAPSSTVFHLDSDMLFGGGSPTWVAEAQALLARRDDVVLCSPLPGPPTPDGSLPPHVVAAHASDDGGFAREPSDSVAYSMTSCSTRLLLFDRDELVRRLGPLEPRPPQLRSVLRARVEGQVPAELPEGTISRRMVETGQRRVDFLGAAPGAWSLHPPLRSPEFYAALPGLVARVEAGDVPDTQRGDFDVNDSLVDWSTARAAAAEQVWQRRLRRRALSLLGR